MKRFLFAIIALMAVVNVKGATVTGALTNVADPVITYTSVDAQNHEITLSAKLYYKTDEDVDFIMINCHPTITHNDGCPTGNSPQMDVVKYMISEGALVVCPDYIGFSGENGSAESKNKIHPYMCATLTGRNVLDAYKAAVEYVKTTGGRTISPNYYTINVGYSQGGATALAFQRYLETQASQEDQALVNLRGSVCGAGPYDQNIVFDVYENKDGKGFATLDYPIYLLYVLQGHKQAFGETTMRKLELEDCFTPEFWAACQGNDGFLAKLNAKDTNVDDLNKVVKDAGFTTFYSIINEAYRDHKSKVYRTIHKTLEQSNLLAGGWDPKTPIIFYHDKAGHDIVVPYACTKAALTRFGYNTADSKCSYVDAIDDYGYINNGSRILNEAEDENWLWHPAVFRSIYDRDTKYPGQISIILASTFLTDVDYKFSQLDHRTFGARFYAQILGMRRILRPDYDANGKYPGDNNGTADEINIEPSTPKDEFTIAAEATSTEGTGDRVKTAFTYDLPQGKPVFVQFAADVDGYYFGCDAPRYKVTLNGDGEAVSKDSYRDITNTEEDFKAGEVYLLTAVDAGENNILSMTAGVTMKTVDSPLSWRELNMRLARAGKKGEKDTGKAYVSNYMPFAYKTPDGATAYAMTVSDEENYLQAKAFTGAVPVRTGTLIEADNAGDVVLVLAPDVDGEAEAVELSDNILSGTYVEIDNNKENFYHFGWSNYDNLGYWKFPNLQKVRAYSSYINMADSGAKGFVIDFTGDATGIVSINENEDENDNLYNIAGQRVNENAKGIIIKNGKKYLVK